MQVNKYCAKTIKEATALIKNNLGQDAMIVSTDRFKGEDGKEMFEMSAVSGGADTAGNYADSQASKKVGTIDEISGSLGEVKAELMNIKEALFLLQASDGVVEKLMMSPAGLSFYAKLIRQGVDAYYAKNILERSGAFKNHSHNGAGILKKRAVKELMQVIDVKDPFAAAGTDTNQIIAAFVGTTGVGKTTTIAKLAARLMLKHKKTVGLISIDTYRIGALEQLKTYANILGIPCFQAFKRKDLLYAFGKMESKDVILIDTAGRSQYDVQRIKELKEMIGDDSTISSHLLLSVGTTQSEMIKTAASFAPLKFQTYIFTKLDESEKFGSIINQVMKLKLPVSYITTGQSVPEDIEPADKKTILDLLLNEEQK